MRESEREIGDGRRGLRIMMPSFPALLAWRRTRRRRRRTAAASEGREGEHTPISSSIHDGKGRGRGNPDFERERVSVRPSVDIVLLALRPPPPTLPREGGSECENARESWHCLLLSPPPALFSVPMSVCPLPQLSLFLSLSDCLCAVFFF